MEVDSPGNSQGPRRPGEAANDAVGELLALPVFDPAALAALTGELAPGDDLAGQLVAVYVSAAPEMLRELVEAVRAAGEVATTGPLDAEIVRLAHALKSSSAQVGATRLSRLAGAIESDGKAGCFHDRARRIDVLARTLDDTIAALAGHVRLPVPPRATHAVAAPGARLGNEVLVIDDDPAVRHSIREVLAREGLHVVEAATGEEGIARFRMHRPDVVMLDLLMPGMDGFHACETIRAIEGAAVVPILVMTGLDDYGAVDRAYEAGATDFIAKPLHWPVLSHRIRFLIRTGMQVRELQRSEARNRALLEAVPDTLLALSRTGTFTSFKPGLAGGPGGEIGQKLSATLPPEVTRAALDAVDRALAGNRVESIDYRMPLGEQMHHYEARIVPSGTEEVIALVRDVTPQKRHEERIARLAYYDGLTGLPNRFLFHDRLAAAIARAERDGTHLAVLFVDLDRFKAINDSLGHKAGDELLQIASARLGECLRASDAVARPVEEGEDGHLVSRWAGDEFTVLLPALESAQEAGKVAARVIERFSAPFEVDGRSLFVTTSVGVALYPENGRDPATLLRSADSAMYTAKSEGRNTFRFYSRSMSEAALERLEMVARLRKALEEKRFILHYQPQVALASDRVTGAEALVRWADASGTMIPPSDFIPLAEDTGLIQALGRFVLETACRQCADWRAEGRELTVAVNVSARQLREPGFVEEVATALRTTGLPSRLLELELTETILLEDDDQSLATLHALHRLGVRIALDDFGTGFSSLTYLQRFPLSTVKIDRSFVSRALEDAGSVAIVRAIIAMARSLHIEVVAEGAETVAHIDLLRRLGCEEVQGWGIARPLPPAEFARFMDAREAVVKAAVPATLPAPIDVTQPAAAP
jgi:diguanylate cyclase (GGDEF)-like protein